MVNHIQSANVGVDRIGISTSNFTVNDGKRLTLVQGNIAVGTGVVSGEEILWHEADGTAISGEKAFYNGPWFTIEIISLKRTRDVKLFIYFNAAKCIRGDNITLATLDELKYIIEPLSVELRAVGVSIDLLNATMSSIEIAQNVLVDGSFETYQPFLQQLHFPRMEPDNEDTSITWSNSRRKSIVYDKAIKSSLDYGLLRFETLFKKADEIRRRAGISSLKDLLRVEPFDKLCHVHTNIWKKAFEYLNPTFSGTSTSADLICGLEASKARGGQWNHQYWKQAGLTYWTNQIGLNEVLNCVSRVGNANMVSNMRKEIMSAAEVSCHEQSLLSDIQSQLFDMPSCTPDD